MKSMTCKQLGGACDTVFTASSFDEVADLSKAHGTEMYQIGDQTHIAKMHEMMELMKKPEEMQKWFADKRAEFDAL